jgi:hypothetical protein
VRADGSGINPNNTNEKPSFTAHLSGEKARTVVRQEWAANGSKVEKSVKRLCAKEDLRGWIVPDGKEPIGY